MKDTSTPDDLCTIAEAERELGVTSETIRRWTREGKGGKLLPTYRIPGDPHRVRVSRRSVVAFQSLQVRAAARKIGGSMSFSLSSEDADALRNLAKLMTARVGVPIAYTEAMRAAVQHATKLEEARAKARACE